MTGRSAEDKMTGAKSGFVAWAWLAVDGAVLVCDVLSAMVLCSAERSASDREGLFSIPRVGEGVAGKGVAWGDVAGAASASTDSFSSAAWIRRFSAAGSTGAVLLFLAWLAACVGEAGDCLTLRGVSVAWWLVSWEEIPV